MLTLNQISKLALSVRFRSHRAINQKNYSLEDTRLNIDSTALRYFQNMQNFLLTLVSSLSTSLLILSTTLGMGRIGLVHLEAITKAPGVTPVIVSNPTISKAEVRRFMKKIVLNQFLFFARNVNNN